ncbi:MAG TPA: surface-adhesin E family protein, partial [Burkholderiaceae bacterium]
KSIKVLVYVRCATRTVATAQTVPYAEMYGAGDAGAPVQHAVQAKDFAPPAPGSVSADWVQLVCRKPAAKRR